MIKKIRESAIKGLSFFLVIMLMTFGSVLWYTISVLETENEILINKSLENEFILLKNSLDYALREAKITGDHKVEIIKMLVANEFHDDKESIAKAIDNYEQANNPVRKIISNVMLEDYFRNIVSDMTDPFVLKGNRIELDQSENCSYFGDVRKVEQEMLMHANPYLAKMMLTRILLADTGDKDRPIFFQFITDPYSDVDYQKDFDNIPDNFKGKKATVLETYDMAGLKKKFMETGSWVITFGTFEFITPSYIYNKEDIAGRPYVESGLKTGIERLSINTVFNFKLVIDNNPSLRSELKMYEKDREYLVEKHTSRERSLYLILILVMIICFITMSFSSYLIREVHFDRYGVVNNAKRSK